MVILVVACVPMMLCCKPCVEWCTHKEHHDHHAEPEFDNIAAVGSSEPNAMTEKNVGNDAKADIKAYEELLNGENKKAKHAISEVFIHQLIETIEFVLGTISNTASYLRLWALSLAHSQLAGVFLEYGLLAGWGSDNVVVLTIFNFLLYFAFITVTFGVLLMMDPLECFLHTLRLHWVEFQNKFFKGLGYLYVPFSFKTVFEKEMKRI